MNDAEQRFIEGWRKAGPVLQAYKEQKLATMPAEHGATMLGAARVMNEEPIFSHGLARWQAWMMRWRVLQLTAALKEGEQ